MVEKMASKRTAIGLGPLRTARGGVRFVVFFFAAGRRLAGVALERARLVAVARFVVVVLRGRVLLVVVELREPGGEDVRVAI